MLPTASPTCSSPLTHMSITCLHLSNYDVFLRLHRLQWYWHTVDTWVKLAANQIMIPASGIIDGRLSKQSLQPPRPTFRRLFFSPKPRSACRFFIFARSTCEPVRRLGFWEQILGSLSRKDGDGYENVSLKVKSRCFKNVIALIPSRSIRQMLAIFFWIWILKIFKSLSCVHVLHKTWNLTFLRRCHAVTAKNRTKKRDARAKLLFCQTKSIAFLPFPLKSPSSLLEPPIASEDLSLRTKNCQYSFGELCSNVSDTPTCKPSPITSEVTILHELIYPQAVRLPDCNWLGRTFNHSALWTVLIMLTICKKTFMWYLLLQF